jgi:transcriptional regulator with XRE-family HTH domain
MTKGQRIKELRERRQMTQEELAKKLNTTKQTISKYEKDIVTNIPSDRIEELSVVLNSTPEYIMGWEQVQQKNTKLTDLTARIRTDRDFASLVEGLSKLDTVQLASVKQVVDAFLTMKG